jgi:hypothetical protein
VHQLPRHVAGHFLSGHADRRRPLLQSAEQVGPEPHQGALLQRLQALAFQVRSAALVAPESLMVMAGVLAESQAGLQGAGGWAAALEPQAGLVEDPAGMHG